MLMNLSLATNYDKWKITLIYLYTRQKMRITRPVPTKANYSFLTVWNKPIGTEKLKTY